LPVSGLLVIANLLPRFQNPVSIYPPDVVPASVIANLIISAKGENQ